MPKSALDGARRPKGSPRVPARPRAKKKSSKKAAPAAAPAIMRSQSVHHGTPPVVLDGVVYPVLGCPVDLDPCSNENSIVQARRNIIFPAENGLEIPWTGTVFCNPPYGMPEIEKWIKKCVMENRRNGAEIISLLPAHTSSSWFDYIATTADACFLWGPAPGKRRVKHIGNADAAAFHSCLVYWGPNVALFSSYAGRYAHPWYPNYCMRLLRAYIGDSRLPDGAALSLAKADELLAIGRNDDLVEALSALGNATLGDIIDAGRSLLLSRMRKVTAYELGVALLCASRAAGRPWLDHRIPETPRCADPRQLGLLPSDVTAATSSFRRTPPALPPPSLDEAVCDELARAASLGQELSLGELERVFQGSPTPEIQQCLRRLTRQGRITKHGRDARYTVVQEQDNAAR